jgi:hypothetical protein
MLTPSEVIELITAPANGAGRGKALFLAQREKRVSVRSTPAQRQFIAAVMDRQPQDVTTYQHPANAARLIRDGGPLTPAELMWLQRLPTDPAEVSFDDAVTLASIAKSLSPMDDAADLRVLNQVWLPVKEIHDANAARAELANAQRAMADALAAEHPDYPPNATVALANEALNDAITRRRAQHEAALADARATLDRVAEAKTRRTAVVAV